MEIKTITHQDKRGKTDYKIYDKEEADELGIKYKKWYDAEPGEYGISDDNAVMKLISKKSYSSAGKSSTVYYVYPLGSVFKNSKYNTKKFKARELRGLTYQIGGRMPDTRTHKNMLQRMAMEYAIIPDINRTIDIVAGDHSKSEHTRWYRKLKSKRFMNMVREEVAKLLDDKGFSKDETIDLMRKVVELAEKKGDITNMRHVVEDLIELHGMKEKERTKTIDSIEYKERDLIDNIERTGKAKREITDNG